MEKERLSCVDCGAVFCARGGDNYPKFCPTAKMQEEEKKELLELYEDNKEITVASAEIEYQYYARLMQRKSELQTVRHSTKNQKLWQNCFEIVDLK